MQCYHLPYMAGRAGADVVLAAKNIFGNRSHGRWQQAPIIWNNCGQLVIPGGRKDAIETPLRAAQREYFEETGVDFRDTAVRAAMMCIGEPVLKIFRPDPGGYCCAYQMVSNASPLVGAVNANIGAGVPADDELHDAGLAAGQHAVGLFGPPQLAGWRQAQFNLLPPNDQALAMQKMADPFDWFVRCVEHLVGENYVEPEAASTGPQPEGQTHSRVRYGQ